MAKYEAKTTATDVAAEDYIAALPDPRHRDEAKVLDTLHRAVTGLPPRMWGPSLIGYGSYHYCYASGHRGEAMRAGFSPRKTALTLYLMGLYGERQPEADTLLARLGKHKSGKSCLYIKKLAEVDLEALEGLIALNWHEMNARYPQ